KKIPTRLAPLGRKGHAVAIAQRWGRPFVLLFGGAPAGRRGLSNALYLIGHRELVAGGGDGMWERPEPRGRAPEPRQGHSFTALDGGERAVVFGGMAEGGELLNDVQVLEIGGGQLAWSQVITSVGRGPTPRYSHTACCVPAKSCPSCYGPGLLIFGGEGRAVTCTGSEGQGVRPSYSHEIFLYDTNEACWQLVETGHSFPSGRHGHTMTLVVNWAPPCIHPDGTVATSTAERGWGNSQQQRSNLPASLPSVPGRLLHTKNTILKAQGSPPRAAGGFSKGGVLPPCAIVYGGLNSMYVSSDIWILPLRWREITPFCPEEPLPSVGGEGKRGGKGKDGAEG
ncbi:unnamed protein product, partial [Discosporangium mesarthrocarpum]